mmetsp:Transcript_34693/g.82712  ORF Transcript_34693/g.82712 Transcript_34693/m.82712 type:complete len:291 (-) Transcript_34693:1317-2189(-)
MRLACRCSSTALVTTMRSRGSLYSTASSVSPPAQPYLCALAMAFSSAWRSSVQSRSTSGISKARMRSPAVDRTSSCSLATMSSGVSTGTYSLAASWYIITRRWLSSCACCARATIVAIVALACRSASKECSRTASMSFQTLRSSGLSKCSAAPRCASSCPSMMPSCSSACLALISCALCVFLSSCCSLAATCRSFSVSMRNLKSVRSWHTMSTAIGMSVSRSEMSMARQRRVRTSLDAPGRDTARSRELRELRSRCTAASSSANMAGLSTRSKKGPSSVQKYSPKDLEAS